MSLIVNGVEVTAPKSFKVNIMDLDGENTNRNARGVMLRDRIRVTRKLECEWGPLTSDEIKTILNVISNVYFSVSYPDPMEGQTSKTFYTGDRSVPSFNFKNNMWLGLSFNLIEK
ncbi:hypothetical protein K5V21_13740 [Clostridium sardiniense]|uniref:Prophage protein n=1 Tax=Clostridium sardiniense TaxID=29369 RepID=A0ABS7L0C0_CLOSR|nr:DUF6711 family protein [Clostridium sardiniense]MBY0756508.1 hypothetical protein [Clostridium sardiniense]MDQ0460254.1 hypothetical protein [Clostridium sardiniense]